MIDKGCNKGYNIDMARYDSLRKIQRNQAVRDYVKAHPDLSMQEVGVVFGISGSRIWVIINGKRKAKQ